MAEHRTAKSWIKNAVALSAALIMLPVAVQAGSPFHPPSNLPQNPGGKPPLPTPHPPKIPVTYTLSCTLDETNPIANVKRLRAWVVRNEGRNTAPMGLAFEISDLRFYHANFTLFRALAPGDTDVYSSPTTSIDHPIQREDPCYVTVAH